MNPIDRSAIIAALALSADSRVDQRVAKTLLAENGAPTAADKRQIKDGIEELLWIAALKPASIGVPVYADETREYLEIAVLSLTLRAGAKAARLAELVHRAIPYPVFLILSQPDGLSLSLAHLRWSLGQSGQTVLEDSLVTVALNAENPATGDFLASLNVAFQPRHDLRTFYQGWIVRFEGYTAAGITGAYTLHDTAEPGQARRKALAEHHRLTREIAGLHARAAKETQLNRRVELNMAIQNLNSQLQSISNNL